ncbi:hypothetical protein SAY87_003199 [Trapa incisa]|uniref:Uncharacterized protein n=1 Tax=Trapa incisa TaxID=236973 RepID=A0AAN7KFC8_9MYRT|nr:hypothetical protein SAY87_003199 [Trapa incisa]
MMMVLPWDVNKTANKDERASIRRRRRSISAGGGCREVLGVNNSSMIQKAARAPLRGPGIAQLEKFRLDEIRKREAALAMAVTGRRLGSAPPITPGQGNVPRWPYGSEHVSRLRQPMTRAQLELIKQVNMMVPSAAPNHHHHPSTMEPLSNRYYYQAGHTQTAPRQRKVVNIYRRGGPSSNGNPPPLPRPETAHQTGRSSAVMVLHHQGGSRLMYYNGNVGGQDLTGDSTSSAGESNPARGSREDANIGEVLTPADPRSMDPGSLVSTQKNVIFCNFLPCASSWGHGVKEEPRGHGEDEEVDPTIDLELRL